MSSDEHKEAFIPVEVRVIMGEDAVSGVAHMPFVRVGRRYMLTGRHGNAIQLFRHALTMRPESPMARHFLRCVSKAEQMRTAAT